MPRYFNKIHIVLLIIVVLATVTCTKDYSYEGGNNVIPPRDTTRGGGTGNGGPAICAACIGNDIFIENKWSLHVGNMLYCGEVDTVIATPGKDGFTIYGPSACSNDSGMVITAYLNGEHLTHNITNYTSSGNGFYYYDKITPSYMLITQSGIPFFITIESYDNQTKILTCSFNGFASLANGGSSYVFDGKFKAKVH